MEENNQKIENKKSLTSSEWVPLVTDNVELEHTTTTFDRTKVEEAVKTIFKLVDQINACGELEKRVGSERFENVMIPDWAKVFIYPSKVSILPGYDMKDLVIRPEKEAGYQYDEVEITKAAQLIAQTHKTQRKMICVKELREAEATISQVKFSINGRVLQQEKEGFIPVPLESGLDSNLGDWSNEDEEKVVKDYFLHSFKMFD